MEYTPNPELEKLRSRKRAKRRRSNSLTTKSSVWKTDIKYYQAGERKRRTHRLCTIAGTLESIAPEIKELDITEVMELLEYVFHKEEDTVQRAVQRMKNAHNLRNRRRKGGISIALYHFHVDQIKRSEGNRLWHLPPIAPVKNCTASITVRTATIPTRAV